MLAHNVQTMAPAMRTWLVAAFILMIPIAQGSVKPLSDSEIWQSTGIGKEYAARFINPGNCSKNTMFKDACVKAFKKGSDLLSLNAVMTELPDVASAFVYGSMVNEFLAEFDAHSRIIPRALLMKTLGAGSAPEDVGPGFEFEVNGEGLFVREVFDPSPAKAAGVEMNDRIVYLNGESVGPMYEALRLAKRFLKGKEGSEIQMTVLRRGALIPITFRLASLVLPELRSEIVNFGNRRFAVMTLDVFRDGMCERVETDLKILMDVKPDGLILDLRGNPGGKNAEARCIYRLFASQPISISRRFFQQSLLPAELGLNPTLVRFTNPLEDSLSRPSRFDKVPMVVVINARSASVSELLAASLQDQNRAWLVGERTFGKGTFQFTEELHFLSGMRLLHSVYEIVRKYGRSIQYFGVTPNFAVPFTKSASALERKFLREQDLYPTAAKPSTPLKWREDRINEKKMIKTCAEQRLQKLDPADYQQAFAMAVLDCQIKN